MQCACWCSALDETDLEFNMNGVNYYVPRAQERLVMGSRLPIEAETMSARRHRMNKAKSAMRTHGSENRMNPRYR